MVEGSAKFLPVVRAVAKWQPGEIERLRLAIIDRKHLDEICLLFPARTRDAVRDKYYRIRVEYDILPLNCRQKAKRIDPADYCEYRFQKDAREGSAKLLQALIDAGFAPAMKKSA